MLIPFGILSAAAAEPALVPDYELIETHILASAASEVTFSSLATYASTYKHLQIRMTVRTTRTDNPDFILFRFNEISTASSYIAHRLFGGGSSVGSEAVSGQAGIFLQRYASANTTANTFSGAVIDILDPYSTTKNKTIRVLSGFMGSSGVIGLDSGLFINTASTTSLTLIGGTVAFAAGCRFSLYGIKG